MNRYIFAAEADKIQDVIFRSSKLAEVLGGSALISHFCKDVKVKLINEFQIKSDDIITADGGAFRIILDSSDKCREIGNLISESYYKLIGGTISIANPVSFEDTSDNFKEASMEVQKNLRTSKNSPLSYCQGIHNPYSSFCNICGREVSNMIDDDTISKKNRRDRICVYCDNKMNHKKNSKGLDVNKLVDKNKDNSNLMSEEYISFINYLNGYRKSLGLKSNVKQPDTIEDLGKFDSLSNVAYFTSDVNNMGVVFSKCGKNEARQLSEFLTVQITKSLAEATLKLIDKIQSSCESEEEEIISPVLPLIVGGDDIFAVMCAPYVFDFVKIFSQDFVDKVNSKLKELEINDEEISLTTGIYICKSKFPFKSAHSKCESYLNEAKSKSRSLKGISLISFGSMKEYTYNSKFVSTLKPYTIGYTDEAKTLFSIDVLMDLKDKLAGIPNNHLNELNSMYDELLIKNDVVEYLEKEFKFHYDRINRNTINGKNFKEILSKIGSIEENKYFMRTDTRRDNDNEIKYCTGLIDLLNFSDFLNKI